MHRHDNKTVEGQFSEMAIVDTFTRLIFREEADFSPRDRVVIEAFRSVDPNVFMDSYADMGDYLRNLGVSEMIHLVARIREDIEASARAALAELEEPSRPSRPGLRRH